MTGYHNVSLSVARTRRKLTLTREPPFFVLWIYAFFYPFLSWRGFRVLVCYWISQKTV